MTLQFLARDSI